MLREEGKNFSVEHDIFLFQAAYEFGVGHAAEFPGARVYFYVPKLPVVRFFIAPVREGVSPGVKQRVFGLALFGAPAMAHALGLFQYATPPF